MAGGIGGGLGEPRFELVLGAGLQDLNQHSLREISPEVSLCSLEVVEQDRGETFCLLVRDTHLLVQLQQEILRAPVSMAAPAETALRLAPV